MDDGFEESETRDAMASRRRFRLGYIGMESWYATGKEGRGGGQR